jgi:hypothetical protein
MTLLRAAFRAGLVVSTLNTRELEELLSLEECRRWNVKVQNFEGKKHFLGYAGRYVRRPPIAQRRIVSLSNGYVTFCSKDKRLKKEHTVVYTKREFIDRWAQHVAKRYRHCVRYCGVFASRQWSQAANAMFLLLGQRRPPKPKRLPWNLSIRSLGLHDPLSDSKGSRMRFMKHFPPTAS